MVSPMGPTSKDKLDAVWHRRSNEVRHEGRIIELRGSHDGIVRCVDYQIEIGNGHLGP